MPPKCKYLAQRWRGLFRCGIDLLNFSMGFNIVAPYMVCVTHKWISPSLSSMIIFGYLDAYGLAMANIYQIIYGLSLQIVSFLMFFLLNQDVKHMLECLVMENKMLIWTSGAHLLYVNIYVKNSLIHCDLNVYGLRIGGDELPLLPLYP